MKLKKRRFKDIEYWESSGNVFADLGLPNPEELLAKSQVTVSIHSAIQRQKLTRAEAAKLLQMSPAKLSLLIRGRLLTDFSLDTLRQFLQILLLWEHERKT